MQYSRTTLLNAIRHIVPNLNGIPFDEFVNVNKVIDADTMIDLMNVVAVYRFLLEDEQITDSQKVAFNVVKVAGKELQFTELTYGKVDIVFEGAPLDLSKIENV